MNMTDDILHEIRTKKATASTQNASGDIKQELFADEQFTDTARLNNDSYVPAIAFQDNVSIASKTNLVILGGRYLLCWQAYRYDNAQLTSLVGTALQEILVDGKVVSSQTVTFKKSGTSSSESIRTLVDVLPLQTITLRITPLSSMAYNLISNNPPCLYAATSEINPYKYVIQLD